MFGAGRLSLRGHGTSRQHDARRSLTRYVGTPFRRTLQILSISRRVRRVELRAEDDDQVHAFPAHLAATRLVGNPDATVTRLTPARNTRQQKVLRLRWDRVDLVGSTLTVDNNRVVTRAGMVEGTPKSDAGLRRISVDHGTRDALAQLRAAQERAAESIGCSPFPYVATQFDGVQIHPHVSATPEPSAGRSRSATGQPARTAAHEHHSSTQSRNPGACHLPASRALQGLHDAEHLRTAHSVSGRHGSRDHRQAALRTGAGSHRIVTEVPE